MNCFTDCKAIHQERRCRKLRQVTVAEHDVWIWFAYFIICFAHYANYKLPIENNTIVFYTSDTNYNNPITTCVSSDFHQNL